MKSFLSALVVSLALISPMATAADWTQWRGPGREDRSPDKGLLKAWPEGGPKQLWVFKDAGLGYAGYSIVAGKLFTMGLREAQELVIAVDVATGKEVWSAPAGPRYPNRWGDGPRGTPTVDGDHLYALSGQGMLVCLNRADGKQVWSKSLVKDLGGKLQDWGYTESVLVVGDTVICTPGGSGGTMAALNKKTGAVVWRTTELQDAAQYASPILIQHAGKPQIVQLVMSRFFGVDPANGKVLWNIDFPGNTAVIPTPVYHDGLVYVSAGYSVGCKAVRLTASGAEVVYEGNRVMKNHHGGVVRVEDHLYGYSDGPGWVCQNLKSGQEVWANKSLGKGSVHFADGMLYCVTEDGGNVALVEATTIGWNEKSRFKLAPQSTQRSPQGRIWTHPVVLDGKLYLRDQELLHCYDVRGK